MPKPDTLDPETLNRDAVRPEIGATGAPHRRSDLADPPGTVEIEADSVTEAMSRLAAEVGDDAQIIDARKVERGGIGGFFAKERVVLTARNRTSPTAPLPVGLDALVRHAESDDDVFAALLRDRLDEPGGTGPDPVGFHPGTPLPPHEGGDEDVPQLPAPPPVPPTSTGTTPTAEPLPAPPTAVRPPPPTTARVSIGGVDWGIRQLVALGIPSELVAPLASLHPDDDLGWLDGLVAAITPLCAPDPRGPGSALVGRTSEVVAAAIGAPVTPAGQIPPATGSICTPLTGSASDRALLELIAASRPLHIVIDATKRWRNLLVADPALVSWTDHDAIGDALDLAVRLGAGLGYAPSDGVRSEMIPAAPVDVAVAIRRRIGRRR